MDHWDPAVTDGLAANRPIILFNNTGVASSSGQTPDTVEAQADDAAAFIHALGLTHVDVLGFSIGGYVAQALTLRHRDLVRRLVLAGTKPRAACGTEQHDNAVFGSPGRVIPGHAKILRISARAVAATGSHAAVAGSW